LICEYVHLRIAVVAAVCAIGRKAPRREDQLEDRGIVVGADPAKIRELKIAASGVGEKRGELERTEFESDADFAPLLLENRSDETRLLFGGSF
jgi:hypothetical protein